MTTTAPVIKLGAVAYAPKVITIWEGFKAYFIERGYYFDYVLYSNYESLTEALIAGDVHLRSEEHTSELQSHLNLVCRLLLEKKKTKCDTLTVRITVDRSNRPIVARSIRLY